MPRTDVDTQRVAITQFNGGISDAEKQGIPGSYGFGRNLDIHADPNRMTIMPSTFQEDGGVVTGLVKWMVAAIEADPSAVYYGRVYAYDAAGVLYQRTVGGSWSVLRSVANSQGQGLCYFQGYLYYAQNNRIGRINLTTGAADDIWQTGLNDTTSTGFAPMLLFQSGFVCGHGNSVAYWDGSVMNLAALTLPAGLNVRALAFVDEYVAIGTWKGAAITDSEEGNVFQWDGVNPNYNFNTPILEGGINALLNSRNRLMSLVGSSGIIYMGTQPFTKLQQLPGVDMSKYVEIFPGAVSNWKGFAFIGAAGRTDSDTFELGVYRWGHKADKYPEVLDLALTPSHGDTTNSGNTIGCVFGHGTRLFMGWKRGNDHGIDVVDNARPPFASAYYKSLIVDVGRPQDEKRASYLKATHLPLLSGESIQLSFKRGRAATYSTVGDPNTTVGSESTKLGIPTADILYAEAVLRVDLAQTNGTAPTVTSLTLEYDDGTSEEIL